MTAQGYDDMFESGNFKRRKRMRRHSYRTGLYKEWMTGGGVYRPSYPGTLYMSGQWSSHHRRNFRSIGHSKRDLTSVNPKLISLTIKDSVL